VKPGIRLALSEDPQMLRRTVVFAALLALAACNKPASKDAAPASNAEAEKNHAAGAAFLKKNAMEPGVMTTPSGLQYKILRQGPAEGIHPKPEDEVKVHYEGTLLDGTVFDSSYRQGQPVIFVLGKLIPGWIEGIQLMKPGDEYMLYVPSAAAYGDSESGPIPPGSTLVFRIELLGVLPKGGGVGLG
jgi:peptidylprolyl isomerase/FKBP-type peptidyl-prolyl cis-trans isomerase FklB